MHQVTAAAVQARSRAKLPGWHVEAVSLRCPICGERARVTFDPPVTNEDVWAAPRDWTCGNPDCRSTVHFYVTEQPQRDRLGWLWAHPDPHPVTVPDPVTWQMLNRTHPTLSSSYEQAVNSLRVGAPDASAAMSRRVLEGLVKTQLKDAGVEFKERETLGPLLKKLGECTEQLARPLVDLAEAITRAANPSSHVDLDVEPPADLSTAEHLLTLVSQVATFLLETPRQAAELKALVEASEARDKEGTTGVEES